MKKALLIGNSKFIDPKIQPLTAPKEDIEGLKDLLKNPEIGAFDSVECKFDLGLEAARLAILRLFDKAKKDDMIVLYYAGHGVRSVDGKLYLALPRTQVDYVEGTAFETDFILERLGRCRSKRKIVILDCCHAGAVSKSGTMFLSRRMNDVGTIADNFIEDGQGTYILAACSAGESAFENKKTGYSIYTQAFINAITDNRVSPEKERLTINDIHDHIRETRLYDETVDQDNPHTEPLLIGNYTDEIVFAKNPNVRKPIEKEIIRALEDESHFTRKGAVASLMDLVKGEDKYLAEQAVNLLKARKEKEYDTRVLEEINSALETDNGSLKSSRPKPPEISQEVSINKVDKDLNLDEIRVDIPNETYPNPILFGKPTFLINSIGCILVGFYTLYNSMVYGPYIAIELVFAILGLTSAVLYRRGKWQKESFLSLITFSSLSYFFMMWFELEVLNV